MPATPTTVSTRGDLVWYALREHGRDGALQPGDVVAEALGETDAAELETDAGGCRPAPRAPSSLHPRRRRATPGRRSRPTATPLAARAASSWPLRSRVSKSCSSIRSRPGCLAVLGVADGAGGDGEHALRAEPLGDAPVAREDAGAPADRHGEQAPPVVDAFAEHGELELARELVDTPTVDVGDEQAAASRSCRGRPPRRGSLARGRRRRPSSRSRARPRPPRSVRPAGPGYAQAGRATPIRVRRARRALRPSAR